MKILTLLTFLTATVVFALPLSAEDATPAPPAGAATTASAEGATAQAATAPAQASRPLPKVPQGTPYSASRKKLIIFSALFFLLSVFMASVILRSKEDIPA